MANNNQNNNKSSQFLNQNSSKLNGSIFIIVLLIGYFFLLAPKVDALRQAKNTSLPLVQGQLDTLNQYFQKNTELQALNAKYEQQYKDSFAKLENILPAEEKIPELIAQLDALTVAQGFKIESLEIAEKQAKKSRVAVVVAAGLKETGINLTISGGDYPAFKRFLVALESHLRLLDLASITFAASTEQSASYGLFIKTYYKINQPDNEAAAQPDNATTDAPVE